MVLIVAHMHGTLLFCPKDTTFKCMAIGTPSYTIFRFASGFALLPFGVLLSKDDRNMCMHHSHGNP